MIAAGYAIKRDGDGRYYAGTRPTHAALTPRGHTVSMQIVTEEEVGKACLNLSSDSANNVCNWLNKNTHGVWSVQFVEAGHG